MIKTNGQGRVSQTRYRLPLLSTSSNLRNVNYSFSKNRHLSVSFHQIRYRKTKFADKKFERIPLKIKGKENMRT